MIRKLCFSLVLLFVLIAALLFIDRATGLDAIDNVRPEFLIAAVGTHFVALSFMAARLHLALDRRTRFVSLLDMTVLHNFLLALLPARIADAYYPFLVAARSGGTLGTGVGNLVLLRLMDVGAIAAILGIVLPMVVVDGLSHLGAGSLVTGVLAVVIIIGMSLERCLVWAARIFCPYRRGRLAGRLLRVLLQARSWTAGVSGPQRIFLFAISLGLWAASAATYFVVLRGLGLELQVAQSVFAGQLSELGAVLPVQTVAGIGASEGVMTGVLAAFGTPLAQAAMLAVWCRLTIVAAVAVLFALRTVLVFWHQRGAAKGGGHRPSTLELLFGRTGGFATSSASLTTTGPDIRS